MATASPTTRTPTWSSDGSVYPIVFFADGVDIFVAPLNIVVYDEARNRAYHIHHEHGWGSFSEEMHPNEYDEEGWEIPEEYRQTKIYPLSLYDRERMFKLMQRATMMTRQRIPLELRALWRSAFARICEGAGSCPVLPNLRAYRQVRRDHGLIQSRREFPQVTEHLVLCTKCQHMK